MRSLPEPVVTRAGDLRATDSDRSGSLTSELAVAVPVYFAAIGLLFAWVVMVGAGLWALGKSPEPAA